jgi:hypothetical protein
VTTPVECVILDIPDGLCLNLLGLVVEVGRVRIVADRSGLLGALLASLTCGGAAAADRLEGNGTNDPGSGGIGARRRAARAGTSPRFVAAGLAGGRRPSGRFINVTVCALCRRARSDR